MTRRARIKLPGQPWHVWQRGVNKCDCFVGPGDRIHYLALVEQFAARHQCDVHAYVLMRNHVHLLVTPRQESAVSKLMKDVGQNYVQDFNRANRRTGTLWEGRFKSSVVDSMVYLFTCQRYIELNPVRARIVAKPEDYEWSSYRVNAEGERCDWLTPHPLYDALASEADERRRLYRNMFRNPLSKAELSDIRRALISGRALGGPAHAWPLNLSVGLSPERLRRRSVP